VENLVPLGIARSCPLEDNRVEPTALRLLMRLLPSSVGEGIRELKIQIQLGLIAIVRAHVDLYTKT